jgi:phosphoribosylformylglycinamidine (FGAM) synthase-like amidotransferase family enzyme
LNGRIEIGLDEIEEGFEVGVTAVFGLLLSALSDFVQKGEDLLGCDGCQIAVSAKVLTELAEGGTVGLDRIFFLNSSCGTPCRSEPHGRVS